MTTARPSDADLAALARHQRWAGPRPGDTYRHHKGSLYLVTARALDEATHEDLVVYYPLDPATGVTWARPTADFLAVVEVDGEMVPRFRLEARP